MEARFNLRGCLNLARYICPDMGKVFQLRLEANDLGQLLDGLRCRAEAWRNTAVYLQAGEPLSEFYQPEECRDAEEAWSIAADYERIIADIVRQRDEQKGVRGE